MLLLLHLSYFQPEICLFYLFYLTDVVRCISAIMLVKVLLPSLAHTLCYQRWSKFCHQFRTKGQITSSVCHLNLSELKWVQASFLRAPIQCTGKQMKRFFVVFVLVKCNSECINLA